MIAASQIYLGRGGAKGWVNPYVTDGLVAMWDGEWNAGGGEHDSTSTTWKDLIGSNDLTINSSVVWQENCTFQSSLQYTALRENAVVPWSFAEVVCDWSLIAGTGSISALFSAGTVATGSGPANDMPCIYDNFKDYYESGRTKYFCIFYTNGRPTRGSMLESPVSDSSALHGTLSFSKLAQIVWKDGSQLDGGDQNTSYFYNTAGMILIGTNNLNNERAFKGKIYCVRLYSDILTQSQISANCAIDKARFDLP